MKLCDWTDFFLFFFMPDKHILPRRVKPLLSGIMSNLCDLSTNETEAFLLLMHQSARLLNHISLFHLRINKIYLTSAQTLQCRRRDWNLGAWLNDSVLKTGAAAQFLKDLSVWSLVCAAGTVEVLRAAVSMLNAESLYVQVLLSADWRSPAHRPHHFTPWSVLYFLLHFSHLSSSLPSSVSTSPVGLYPPSSSFVTAVELYRNLDL